MTPELEIPKKPKLAQSTLAQDLAEAGLASPTKITVSTKVGRRTTGFLVECSEHGTMPIEIRKRKRAVGLANRHRMVEHGGLADLEVRT